LQIPRQFVAIRFEMRRHAVDIAIDEAQSLRRVVAAQLAQELLHRGNARRMIAGSGHHCLRRQRLGIQPQLVPAHRHPGQSRIVQTQRSRQAIEPERNP